MDPVKYIQSGILERYVVGELSTQEAKDVERLAQLFPRIADELDAITQALEGYAIAHAVNPPVHLRQKILEAAGTLKKKPMAMVRDFPELKKSDDLSFWQAHVAGIRPPADFGNIYMHSLAQDAQRSLFVVWGKKDIPEEVHDDLYESFIVLEGTCDCWIDGVLTKMVPGDYMAIPLHADHYVSVTSDTPVKVLLQRSNLAA